MVEVKLKLCACVNCKLIIRVRGKLLMRIAVLSSCLWCWSWAVGGDYDDDDQSYTQFAEERLPS